MKAEESVIDFPKAELCPEVWEKVIDKNGMSEVWQLTDVARLKLEKVALYLYDCIKDTECYDGGIGAHITGSITSNQYTENSDVDLHLYWRSERPFTGDAEALNKAVKAHFEENFKDESLDDAYIGKHPIEVYFQGNVLQDMMSVGCYDLFSSKWIVGPDFKDQSYNPYSDLYKEIRAKSEGLAMQIRNMILSIYEMAVVLKKNYNSDFGPQVRPIFLSKLAEVKAMYEKIRSMRKVYSSPETPEQALQYRQSRKWKVADASFKLFDKYGYMAIMKKFIEDYELAASTPDIDQEVVEDILATVKNYISNADKLAEQELESEAGEKKEEVHESFKQIAAKMRLVIEKLARKHLKRMCKKALLPESRKEDPNEKYVREFKDYFGYQDEYMPTATYEEKMDSIARECALRMPTDTEARETEGDAVMMLVLSGDDEAVKAGKKLGDCMMKKGKHDEETLLKRMSDAYKALQDLWSKYEKEKQIQQESVKKLFKKQKLLTERWEPKYDHLPLNQWGERWVSLPSNHYVVCHIDRIAKDCQIDPDSDGPKVDHLGISSVHAFSDGRLLVTVFGGANGGQMPGECNFKLYLAVVKKFINKLLDGHGDDQMFDDAWLVDWDNDCCDDVWTLRFCLTFTKQQLEHFKECTQLPDEADDEGREAFKAEDVLAFAKEASIDCTEASAYTGDGHQTITVKGEFPDRISLDSLSFYWNEGSWHQAVKCKNKWNEKMVDILNVLYPYGLKVQNIDSTDALFKGIDSLNLNEVDEDMKGTIQAAILAAMLAVPGLVSAKQVEQWIYKDGQYSVITKQLNDVRMVGDYTAYQVANIIARTLYAEARSDGVEYGFKPVASVIYNRANGKKEDFAKACLKKWQFSCWNGLPDAEKSPDGFKIKIPPSVNKSKTNLKLWQSCLEIAAEMLAGSFKPVTNANSYYATSMKNPPSWGKELTDVIDLGGHKFGYLKQHAKFV